MSKHEAILKQFQKIRVMARAEKSDWVKKELEEMLVKWRKRFPGERKIALHYVIFNSLKPS